MSLLDELRHETIKEGQHQRGNMRTVHICIRHDNNFVITKFGNIEIVMDAGTERGDHSLDLLIGIDPVQTGFLDIKDFSSQGHNGLITDITAVFGGTECGVTLYDEDLALFRILLRAVRKLSGKSGAFKNGFTPGKLSCLSRGCSCSLCKDRLFAHAFCNLRILLQEPCQLLGYDLIHSCRSFTGTQLHLGLTLELRISDLYGDDCSQALADILTGKIILTVLKILLLTGMIIDRFGECISETGQMGAALRSIDIINEAVDIFGKCIRMLHGDFHEDPLSLTLAVNDIRIQRNVRLVQIGYKFLNTSLIVEGLVMLDLTVIGKMDLQSFCQEGSFSETGLDRFIIEHCRLKDLCIRLEGDLRTVLIGRAVSDHRDRRHDLASFISLHIYMRVSVYTYFKPFGKRIDNGSAYTVQASRYLISAVSEFTARVKDRKDDLQG